jgi:hypothetical protein
MSDGRKKVYVVTENGEARRAFARMEDAASFIVLQQKKVPKWEWSAFDVEDGGAVAWSAPDPSEEYEY